MGMTVLAIGAHADDAIIGAGGLLLLAARAGARVVVVSVVSDFSTRAQTRGQERQTAEEMVALSAEFGLEHRLLGYPYHRVGADDMALKQALAEVVLEVRPDVGLIHHHDDLWPDHSACARLGRDALLFTHGLTQDLRQRQCPLIYAFDLTARQTRGFEPDVFYDVGDVMHDYMRMILRADACLGRRGAGEMVEARFDSSPGAPGQDAMALSRHGVLRLADCLRWGDLGGCRYALGLKTVWGDRRGPAIFG